MNEITLAGCTPTPLANYLKALGIFRLVAEQKDPWVKAFWRGERFVLVSGLSPEELTRFLLDDYRPTPILAPWNGGSGFFPNDNKDGFIPLSTSSAERFAPISEAIATASQVLVDLHLAEKPNPDSKPALLMALRGRGSDALLTWLAAAVVLSGGEPAYPPLLGTGGNDGRLDFTNNFLQRLVELFDPTTGAPIGLAAAWLNHAMYATPTPKLTQKAIGQFAPGHIGGANATSGFSTDSHMNPWDFVLMLEGALLFVTATSRRLESNQQARLAYPFTVYPNSGGSGTMAQPDAGSSRGEIWMPLWANPVRLDEIRVLLGEGRATLGRRAARDGLDFARAVSRLGTDRGIDAFQRYGFMVRNGLAYLATPIARVESRRAPTADLISDLERGHFLDLLRREARGKEAPASLKRAVSQLENALFSLTRPESGRAAIQRALILLGEVMQTLAVSKKGQEAVPVLPTLSPAWVLQANDESAAFRLALSLPSLPRMAAHLTPIEWSKIHRRWQWQPDSRTHVWGNGNLINNLVRIAGRRMVEAKRQDGATEPFGSHTALAARQRDITGLLCRHTDDARVSALLQGLVWIRLPDALVPSQRTAAGIIRRGGSPVTVAYRVIKPFFASASLLRILNRLPEEGRWTLPEEIPRLLAAGKVQQALTVAWRRSRIAGLGWPVGVCPETAGMDGARLLAALTIPIQPADLARLLPRVENQEPEATQS